MPATCTYRTYRASFSPSNLLITFVAFTAITLLIQAPYFSSSYVISTASLMSHYLHNTLKLLLVWCLSQFQCHQHHKSRSMFIECRLCSLQLLIVGSAHFKRFVPRQLTSNEYDCLSLGAFWVGQVHSKSGCTIRPQLKITFIYHLL